MLGAASDRVLSPVRLSTRTHSLPDCPGSVAWVRIPLWVPPLAEKPGPLLDAEALAEPLEEPEEEKEEEPLDLPDEPEPLLEPDPEPDADADGPLPEPEEAAVAGRSL